MANAGQDVQYHNSGREHAERVGTAIHQHPERAADELRREAHHGTATEQRAMWNQVLKTDSASDSASKHLPQGFSITGDEGHKVVKDEKGAVMYDEAKVKAQADKDSQIHKGEGPYQALRRQGMSHDEAMKAAHDVKATDSIGDKGFKQGQNIGQQDDGKGSWHRFDQQRAEQQGLKAVDEANKKIDDEQKGAQGAFDKFKVGPSRGQNGEPQLTKERINEILTADTGRNVRTHMAPEQRKSLESLRDHFDELANGGKVITDKTIKAHFDKQRAENFM